MKTLWDLYQQTIFLLEQPLSRQINFAVITAYNPLGQILTLGTNHIRDKALQSDIMSLRHPYRKVWGCSSELDYSEKSWAVSMPKADAVKLASKYQQNALYWVEQDRLYLLPCLLERASAVELGAFSLRCKVQKAGCCK